MLLSKLDRFIFAVNELIEYTSGAGIVEAAITVGSTMLLGVRVIQDKLLLIGIRLKDVSSLQEILGIQYQ